MSTDLDTLATALCTMVDDLLIAYPEWVPERPDVGIAPKLPDAELITLAVIQMLLGYESERHFIRDTKTRLRSWFPYIPKHSGRNKRLRRAAATMQHVIAAIARDCPCWYEYLVRGLQAGGMRPQPSHPTTLGSGGLG